MAKDIKSFYCENCGARYPKWLGKCEDCNQWNTIIEIVSSQNFNTNSNQPIKFSGLNIAQENIERRKCNISEFDRVLGGGAVPGSVVLIGGDPGIGKSTMLLQVVSSFSINYNCVYISGEESSEQICMRAKRLNASDSNVKLACETNISAVLKSINEKTDFLVIDSIQTLYSPSVESIPGTVTQIRACTHELIHFAKSTGTTVFLVGHVTKEGAIAGPKVLEHMVDTVLYFEGERGNSYRILRAVKNRYGPCDELGIFEMHQDGLKCVKNPSTLFLTQRDTNVPGTSIFAGIEGSRPILVEVQALVSRSYFPSPRRTVVGWDINRLFTILAVLEAKCRISFSDKDVYLNVAGGLKISEPAGDLAVALSLLSASSGKMTADETCAFGEIGLTGEIRSVSRFSERIKEAEKLGFKNIIVPVSNDASHKFGNQIKLIQIKQLSDIIKLLGGNYAE